MKLTEEESVSEMKRFWLTPAAKTSWLTYFIGRLIKFENQKWSFKNRVNWAVEMGLDVGFHIWVENGDQGPVCVCCGRGIEGLVPMGFTVEEPGERFVFFYTFCLECSEKLEIEDELIYSNSLDDSALLSRLKKVIRKNLPIVKIYSNRKEEPFKLVMQWAQSKAPKGFVKFLKEYEKTSQILEENLKNI